MEEYIEEKYEKLTVQSIEIDKIRPNPYQPRVTFDNAALKELTASIAEHGVLQPITVRRLGNSYELIAGERRLRASQQAGFSTIPAIIVEASDEKSSVLAMIENIQRQNLNYFEEAQGYQNLAEDYNLRQEEIARMMGKSQSAVANKLRLLKLPLAVRRALIENDLSERHARALLRLNDEADRINVTNYIIEHELNVSRTEEYIDEFLKAKENPQPVVEPESGKHVVRLFKDVRFFLNTLNRAVGVMVDAGIGATVKQQESDDGLTLTICIPHAKG